MRQKLFLITDSFPYGTGEKTFIIPELPYLSKYYDVTIISRAHRSQIEDRHNITKLDNNIKVINIDKYCTAKILIRIKHLLCIFCLFDKRVRKEFIAIIHERKNKIHKLIHMFSYYIYARDFLKSLHKAKVLPNSNEQVIFYTYWHTYATTALLMYKEKNHNIKVITRTHRYDLFNEATYSGRQVFRDYANSLIDGIFFISKLGMDYYIDTFSQGIHKPIFHLSRLGVTDPCMENPPSNGEFHLISCSNVISIKRIEYIIEALEKISDKKEIYWTHFGDGKELNAIKSLASKLLDHKKNIHYTFSGHLQNKDIIQYYGKYHVDCFITTSSSEGIPVSIQEACSFGIPIIGTNVGGMSEIIENNINGFLLNANPTISEVTDAIEKLYSLPEESITIMRKNSRKLWEEKFDADKNYSKFAKYIHDSF